MMVETILESSQDFGMSTGAGGLPQWKRELLQRRAARSRPAPAPAPAPPPPPPAAGDDDEELRYGPGIVKRLKSRYLSLALRDAPRRRASVLRRATSLEHLLDERPPPAPRPPQTRPPRPVSLAQPVSRTRDVVKRARSVDALSRLETRDEPQPPSPSPPPPVAPPAVSPPPPPVAPPAVVPPPVVPQTVAPPPVAPPPVAPPPPPPAPRPPLARSARPPRRPAPLLREAERPPPDVVRSTLRKFESAPPRRTAPAARVSAVLRGLEGGPRTSTPEPRSPAADGPEPSPDAADASAVDEPEGGSLSAEIRPVSRAALEGIARAGSSMRFSFEVPRRGSHLPPLAAANAVLVGRARRIGIIRPMPAPALGRATSSPTPPPLAADVDEKVAEPSPRTTPPPPADAEPSPPARTAPERREPPPSALVEPIVRPPPDDRPAVEPTRVESPRPPSRDSTPEPVRTIAPETEPSKPLMNGHAETCKQKTDKVHSRLGGADIERAWNGTPDRKTVTDMKKEPAEKVAPWLRRGVGGGGGARRGGAGAAGGATSVVFNFSDRKEVPDYIENDGLILRASRRNRIKPGEPGVVVLRPEALAVSESESSGDEGAPPSPCGVRFVNDNVLINGRSSMPARPDKHRQAKLKLQFDDSLTRTFEYPSETSLCEDSPDATANTLAANTLAANTLAANAMAANTLSVNTLASNTLVAGTLAANTHIVSAALARYTPAKTVAEHFQLGVTRRDHRHDATSEPVEAVSEPSVSEEATLRPCGADGRSWSDARSLHTDLLF